MKSPIKLAESDHDILSLFTHRYSPYVFEPTPIEQDKLLKMLEAVRWAASSFNEQPWRYILAERTEEGAFSKALGCLMDANQAWAKHAGALMLCCSRKNFTYNDKPNRVAQHDLGIAGAHLTLQGMALGVYVHMMGGVDLEKVREEYDVPEAFEPVTAIAIGYPGKPSEAQVEAEVAQRDEAKRERMELSEFVFGGTWGKPAKISQ